MVKSQTLTRPKQSSYSPTATWQEFPETHCTGPGAPKEPASSTKHTHRGNTSESRGHTRANAFSAHGSLTWREIVEIPRKPETSIFSRSDFLFAFSLHCPSRNPFLSPRSRAQTSQHNATQRALSLFSLNTKTLSFFAVSPILAMPKAKSDAKAADSRYRVSISPRNHLFKY